MDLQTYINNHLKVAREERMRHTDQLTLGELLKKLEEVQKNYPEEEDQPHVNYDFGYFSPTRAMSWRGVYAEVCFNYEQPGYDETIKLPEFTELVRKTIGATFTGYKGGEYTMTENTPVWVSNNGEAAHTAVVEVIDLGWQIIIATGYRE